MVRKCNLPLTSLSAHQQILLHLYVFVGHNLRCALTISPRMPGKHLTGSLLGVSSDYGPNLHVVTARGPTGAWVTPEQLAIPPGANLLMSRISVQNHLAAWWFLFRPAPKISVILDPHPRYHEKNQQLWTLKPPSAASSEKLLGSALDHLEIASIVALFSGKPLVGYTFCHSWAFFKGLRTFWWFQWIWALFGVLTHFTPMDLLNSWRNPRS